MSESLSALYDFAVETAYLAGRGTLALFQTGLEPEYKGDRSPVTIADRQAEALIRQRIEQHYPQHAILGEEYGAHEPGSATHRWHIDPIDGTKSFVRGVPLYAVLLGLEIEGTVQVGACYFPALDEMVSAATGLGCWWNGRRARVSRAERLAESVVVFTDPASFGRRGRADAWARLCDAAYYRTGWSDAYGYALVATGRAEVALDPSMSPWDCGPFPPILAEAGGFFGDWQGRPNIYAGEALATPAQLLAEVLDLLRGGPAAE